VPPRCSICKLTNVKQIDSRIKRGESLRYIALQELNDERRFMSVQRHTENCLQLKVSALIEQRKIEAAIDFEKELADAFFSVKKQVLALERWLSDPDDPERFSLEPRADDLLVIYQDNNDLTQQGDAKVKKATLKQLLLDIAEKKPWDFVQVVNQQYDNRKLYLETMKTLGDKMDRYAKIHGMFTKDKENPSDIAKTLEAYNLWLKDHTIKDGEGRIISEPSAEDKSIWIARFAKSGGVEVRDLAQRAGVQMLEGTQ